MEASATPPTMGTSDSTTAGAGRSPRNMALSRTLKKGSMALMVCVKDTCRPRHRAQLLRNTLLSLQYQEKLL